MGTNRITGRWALAPMVALVLIAALACGSDAESVGASEIASGKPSTVAANAPTPMPTVVIQTEAQAAPTIVETIESTPIPAPEAKLASSAGTEGVVDFIAGESAGSSSGDPEVMQIKSRATDRYEAFRVKDWDAYRDTCNPAESDQITIEQLEFDHDRLLHFSNTTPESFSQQAGSVQLLGPFDALVQYSFFENGKQLILKDDVGTEPAQLWKKIDDLWYAASCGVG